MRRYRDDKGPSSRALPLLTTPLPSGEKQPRKVWGDSDCFKKENTVCENKKPTSWLHRSLNKSSCSQRSRFLTRPNHSCTAPFSRTCCTVWLQSLCPKLQAHVDNCLHLGVLLIPPDFHSPWAQVCSSPIFLFLFKILFLYLERGEGREKERERNINVWLPLTWPPTGDLACNPDMCPDRESNWWPFGLQPELNPLSYASQGPNFLYIIKMSLAITQLLRHKSKEFLPSLTLHIQSISKSDQFH